MRIGKQIILAGAIVASLMISVLSSCNADEDERLTEPTVVVGTVTKFDTGEPLEGAKVILKYSYPTFGVPPAHVDSVYVDGNGEFQIFYEDDGSFPYTVSSSERWGVTAIPVDTNYHSGPGRVVAGIVNDIKIELKQK